MPDTSNLRKNVRSLLDVHERLNKKIADAAKAGEETLGHVDELGKTYASIADDITFAAEKLGNGGEHSEEKPNDSQQ